MRLLNFCFNFIYNKREMYIVNLGETNILLILKMVEAVSRLNTYQLFIQSMFIY